MYEFLVMVLLIYFAPTVVAVARDHQDRLAIGAVNLLFGWTMVGWLLAFIWSLTGVREYYRGSRPPPDYYSWRRPPPGRY
jgi:hypothetical protein